MKPDQIVTIVVAITTMVIAVIESTAKKSCDKSS